MRLATVMSAVTQNISEFSRSFKQSLFSLIFDVLGIFAGLLIAFQYQALGGIPWAFMLYPGILSVRGVINGIFSGKMSTGLHMGTIKPSFTGNTVYFKSIYSAMSVLTLIGGFFTGLMISLLSIIQIHYANSLYILLAATASLASSFAVISPLTVFVSIISYKLGLDPDYVVYPVMSTVADILATLCYVAIIQTVLTTGFLPLILVNTIYIIAITIIGKKFWDERAFQETIQESFITILIVTIIVMVTGSFLQEISNRIGRFDELYIIYPSLIDTVGDTGSIVGSMVTTRLALGTLKPYITSLKKLGMEVAGCWTASLTIFTLMSVTAVVFTGNHATFGTLTQITVTSNLISVPLIISLSYIIAIKTYKKGLDPDNFVNPIESTLADMITTSAIYLAALIAGI
ncbi:MAG: hypothetical protein DRJ47_05150 [Thermoprotei archaeon]|nr:MAG: hypothetical protein DRJ47_05150 [Thermoprotei archaeon]